MTYSRCLLLAVLCTAIALQPVDSKSRWSTTKRFAVEPLKKMYSPVASTIAFTNRSTTALKQHSSSLWKRIQGNRKKLTSQATAASSKLFSLSDPLHAYPNALDKAFHRLFHRFAVFEVNNADAVRLAINSARSLSIFSVLVSAVVGIVALAVAIPVGVAAANRVDDADVEYERVDRWRQINHMAQMVLDALESGQLKYNV